MYSTGQADRVAAASGLVPRSPGGNLCLLSHALSPRAHELPPASRIHPPYILIRNSMEPTLSPAVSLTHRDLLRADSMSPTP